MARKPAPRSSRTPSARLSRASTKSAVRRQAGDPRRQVFGPHAEPLGEVVERADAAVELHDVAAREAHEALPPPIRGEVGGQVGGGEAARADLEVEQPALDGRLDAHGDAGARPDVAQPLAQQYLAQFGELGQAFGEQQVEELVVALVKVRQGAFAGEVVFDDVLGLVLDRQVARRLAGAPRLEQSQRAGAVGHGGAAEDAAVLEPDLEAQLRGRGNQVAQRRGQLELGADVEGGQHGPAEGAEIARPDVQRGPGRQERPEERRRPACVLVAAAPGAFVVEQVEGAARGKRCERSWQAQVEPAARDGLDLRDDSRVAADH